VNEVFEIPRVWIETPTPKTQGRKGGMDPTQSQGLQEDLLLGLRGPRSSPLRLSHLAAAVISSPKGSNAPAEPQKCLVHPIRTISGHCSSYYPHLVSPSRSWACMSRLEQTQKMTQRMHRRQEGMVGYQFWGNPQVIFWSEDPQLLGGEHLSTDPGRHPTFSS